MEETLFMSLSSMPLLQLLSYIFLLALLSLSIPSLFSGFLSGRRLPPAPKLRLPILGHIHLLSPVLHRSFHRLSLRYGPLFSLQLGSIPCIIVSSPYYAKQFLHANDLSFCNHLLTIAIKRLTYDRSLAFAPYGPYWKFIKRVTLTELLGGRAIANFQPLRSQECRELLRLLSEKAVGHETVNLTDELLKLTNNVISRMMFGELEDARNVVRDVTKINGEFNFSDFVWIAKKLDFQGFEKRIEDIFQRFDKLVESIISKRERIRESRKLENGKGGKGESEMRDFLDILLDYLEDESSEIKIDRVHVKGLILDFFAGGTDTRAITTEWALVELLKNPKVMRKAREEIDRVVGETRLVQESDLPNLPFMQAIIKETFRLHPPVPFISRRSLAECKVENYVIPENTLLFVNLWAMGRDPNNWESPMDFRPERFLEDSMGLVDLKDLDFQYLPFGAGKRMCPGTIFAMLELPSLLAAIIQCFDFEFVGPKGETLMVDDVLADMSERPGLTAPRAHDFVCVPIARPKFGPVLKSIGPNAELL